MNLKKRLFKLIITILFLEGIYLFAIPKALDFIAQTDYIKQHFEQKNNAGIKYNNVRFKTHLKPSLSVQIGQLELTDKNDNSTFLNIKNGNIKLKILPLLGKKIAIEDITSNKITINIIKDENNIFNFEKLFPKNNKKTFNLSLKQGITAKLKGEILTNNKNSSEFDIDIQYNKKSPKSRNPNKIEGHFFAYDIDLESLKPIFQNFVDEKLIDLNGKIDFIQLSAEVNEEDKNQIIFNTTFNDLVYNRDGWKNHIIANGTNKIQANVEFLNKIIEVNSLSYIANKIDIKADGEINLQKTPELDINVAVKNSRAENIASILPPNLAPEHMIIEKIKTYGVFGDVDGKIKIKGKIPKPDITGYVKGRNVHILDKPLHKLHKGTIDLTFDKRILNMDIIVDLFDNQRATVKGYTYMFREGINNVTVKTTDNIDFPLAQKIIIPISKVFNFQMGPILEMDITSGKGIIDLNIRGAIDLIDIHGYSSFDKAKLTYNGLYGEVRDGKGRVDFDGDVITVKSEKAFVGNNPLDIDGKVKINHNLDFNIASNKANATDVLEIINKSELLKDVKQGLAIITEASGDLKLFVNMKSKIVPVPYGHPPLPPEEAFEDMKVNGNVYLFGNTCKLEGFYTPIEQIKGIVDFTETVTDLHAIQGISGTSPISISGQIKNDIETRIPDVDVTITSKSVNLKDTIRFLTKSYMYPSNYHDLSSLYKIASKHDLYFKYKAKSIDFLTDKAYAEMNIIPDKTTSVLKAKSGKVIMENSTIKVENIIADLFDSTLSIDGNVYGIDTLNPIYDLKINANKVNLANLNDTSKIEILPDKAKEIIDQFSNFKGFADFKIDLNKNLPIGEIKLTNIGTKHSKTNIPLNFDDFVIYLKDNKAIINNIAAQIDDIPFYGNFTVSELSKIPHLNGFFTSKITNNFLQNYIPSLAKKFEIYGDMNFSAKFNGTTDSFNIYPQFILNPDADVVYDGTSLGETTDKREFDGHILIEKSKINIKKLDYIKYVSSQNNKMYPITFASLTGLLNINKDNVIIPKEITLKTNKNLSARILNVFLKKQILKQGTLNCDLKYIIDSKTGIAKLLGDIDCRNIDIPIFDTLVKNIKISAENKNINIDLFGFISDSKIKINSILENNLEQKPQIKSLNIDADQLDINKLFANLTKTHNAMSTNNNIKNINLSGLSLKNGTLDIEKLTIKSLVANNFKTNFSIDENGIFNANDTHVSVGSGNIVGNIAYNLVNTEFSGDFEVQNVDANYVAETLFNGKNQIYGNANGKIFLTSKGVENKEIINNLSGYVLFDITDGKMPKLGSLEYLLRASNIIKSGITGFSLNSILELLNLVKTGHFSSISGGCQIENGVSNNIEIFSQGENLSLYIHGKYDISQTNAEMEILGKLSKKISTIFGTIGNTSLNTFFKLIPGISMLDLSRKDFIQDVEKIPSFTNGNYDARTFQAIINGNINESGYVQSFKWVE